MNPKIKEFLEEFTELSRKHNMLVEGCGCCGSPWIYTPEEGKIKGHYKLRYKDADDEFCWEDE